MVTTNLIIAACMGQNLHKMSSVHNVWNWIMKLYWNQEIVEISWIMLQASKVCKSAHYRIIQINHQPDAAIFQFIILTFIYSSTCFGRFPAHHQKLNDCSGTLWFYLRIVVTVVLCSWSGRPDHEHSTTVTTIRR